MKQVAFAFAKTWDKNFILLVHWANFPGFPTLDFTRLEIHDFPGFPQLTQTLLHGLDEHILQLIDRIILSRAWLGTMNLLNTTGPLSGLPSLVPVFTNINWWYFMIHSETFCPSNYVMKLLCKLNLYHFKKQICTNFVLGCIITNATHWALIDTISFNSRVWRTLTIFCVKGKIIMSTKHKWSIIFIGKI